MESLFGRFEAAALLAVERANGGELAPLEQVIVAFEGLFGTSVTPGTFIESIALLIDARLVDWVNNGLELTLEGRRAIRRSGAHWDPELAEKVADHLSQIDEDGLAPEGELPCPSEADFRNALQSLGRGRLEGRAPVPGDVVAPSGMAGHQTIGARLTAGLPAGFGLRVEVPGVNSPPLVSPVKGDREDAGDEERD